LKKKLIIQKKKNFIHNAAKNKKRKVKTIKYMHKSEQQPTEKKKAFLACKILEFFFSFKKLKSKYSLKKKNHHKIKNQTYSKKNGSYLEHKFPSVKAVTRRLRSKIVQTFTT
jgi:hypothetical protein